jgi:hypothetical protein
MNADKRYFAANSGVRVERVGSADRLRPASKLTAKQLLPHPISTEAVLTQVYSEMQKSVAKGDTLLLYESDNQSIACRKSIGTAVRILLP